MENKLAFIRGNRILLRPVVDGDYSERYLSWLNDPEVNLHSQRRAAPIGWEGMRSYVEHFRKNPEQGFVLAVVEKETFKHIGNVALVDVEAINRTGQIAILVGDKSSWNKGYGTEIMYLVSKHAFFAMNLNKVLCGSFNPAFIRCVEKLAWCKEGVFRKRIWTNGEYVDQVWMSQLREEFVLMENFEEKSCE